MSEIRIAFWNLQNLFDTTVSELATDLEFTPVHGWDRQAYRNKVANLAHVIGRMHDGHGPDLLGVCEVENASVARDLIEATGRSDWALAHIDSPDIRGIDTSLVYSKDVFDLMESPIEHMVHLRYATRDIFEVRLRVKANGAELIVLVNHWPSRSMGTQESEAFRMTVASHCGRIVDRHLKLDRNQFFRLNRNVSSLDVINQRWNRNILLMGDFNDEPFNRSVMDMLRASSGTDHLEEVVRASQGMAPSFRSYEQRETWLFNLMWPHLGRLDAGTYHYSQSTNTLQVLDQFIISRGLFYGESGLKIRSDAQSQPIAEIFTHSDMTTRKGRPKPFDRRTRTGFSDHFPIQTNIDVV